ncbi:hypothetical protein LXA43DRAFT_1039925 [Ganoderma leucocontextum]|nr:hypothetical protein LXA43DRAFT_1039925 [Ganoderma leucocontextum]
MPSPTWILPAWVPSTFGRSIISSLHTSLALLTLSHNLLPSLFIFENYPLVPPHLVIPSIYCDAHLQRFATLSAPLIASGYLGLPRCQPHIPRRVGLL